MEKMNEELRRAIGQRLLETRKSAGLTQTYVADELGLKVRQTVAKWERGETMPRLNEWFQIGQMYGVSLDYLVYGIRTVPVSKYGMVGTVLGRAGVQPQGPGFDVPTNSL
jgi:transcriptional regulator with XRE-family HTH domain